LYDLYEVLSYYMNHCASSGIPRAPAKEFLSKDYLLLLLLLLLGLGIVLIRGLLQWRLVD
jgi:hypothetical protein